MLAEKRPINQRGNLTSCSHLPRHRCSGVGRQGTLTLLSLLHVCSSHQACLAPACRAEQTAAKATEAGFVSICFCSESWKFMLHVLRVKDKQLELKSNICLPKLQGSWLWPLEQIQVITVEGAAETALLNAWTTVVWENRKAHYKVNNGFPCRNSDSP